MPTADLPEQLQYIRYFGTFVNILPLPTGLASDLRQPSVPSGDGCVAELVSRRMPQDALPRIAIDMSRIPYYLSAIHRARHLY